MASCSPRKMLQFDVWQLATHHFLPKLFTVDYLAEVRCVKLLSWDQSQDTIKIIVKNIDRNDLGTRWMC